MKVSVLLLTFNEASNLPRCLAALDWCDDVVVIDSGSTDETVAIARGWGARVIERSFDNFACQRNFGLDDGALQHDWVLHLDADEVVTQELRAEIEMLEPGPDMDAYWCPSRLMFGETWLRHAGMYPTYQVRLARRDGFRFRQVGHGQREDTPSNRIGRLSEPYLHYSFSHGLYSWLQKHARYARDEAKTLVTAGDREEAGGGNLLSLNKVERRRAAKRLASSLPLWMRPPARFIYIYGLRRGFIDGRAGLAYALMLSVYEGMIAVLAYEALLRPGSRQRPLVQMGDPAASRASSPVESVGPSHRR